MYVCNCNGIRERDVSAAIASGACTPKQVFDHAGCRPQCARCVCDMREMIDDAQVSLSLAAE
ncbi:bacterioferritin-associated ferredoxin [Asticcacaulis sp. AC402]|uniref:(2Fe-2S)-binding protein n=1 Tax=Asticcacaulis sp. AC402 TaxID=1282361 RepID=UPI00041B220A|nr:(2Fe-2S)-binding protein [Asticcacaulis sp. AC402]